MIQWNKYLNLSSPKNNKLILWFAGAFFFLALFIKFTSEVFEDNKIQNIDQSILLYIGTNLRHTLLNGLAVDITALGSPALISLVTLITMGALLTAKDRIGALYLFLAVSGGTLWMSVLKKFVGRPRPQIISHLVEVEGLSYPSGHSLVSTVTYLTLAILVCRHIKSYKVISVVLVTATLIISLIAFSRLYLGVHYPSDVFSGMLFGISWVLMLTAFFKTFTGKMEKSL
ncbi:MAG: phosphatase PAP2 family protein [Bacteriovorax sp.]|nr:phosphatase PAP2 family protein [Bacteriovorax sp.]